MGSLRVDPPAERRQLPDGVDTVFVMGHGTRSTKGRDQFLDAVERLDAMISPKVGAGFIELCEPNMYEAIDKLLLGEPKHLVIAPMILLPAGHLKDDGAALTRYARQKSPSTKTSYAADLGIHDALIDSVAEQIRLAPLDDFDSILLVGRGSSDKDANSDLFKIARLINELFGQQILVEGCFISLAKPSVADGLHRLSMLGAKRIIVQPYFLYTGALVDRIHQEATAWINTNHVGIEVGFGAEIGRDQRVLDVMVERITEASGGNVRMSCDVCIYRGATITGVSR